MCGFFFFHTLLFSLQRVLQYHGADLGDWFEKKEKKEINQAPDDGGKSGAKENAFCGQKKLTELCAQRRGKGKRHHDRRRLEDRRRIAAPLPKEAHSEYKISQIEGAFSDRERIDPDISR